MNDKVIFAADTVLVKFAPERERIVKYIASASGSCSRWSRRSRGIELARNWFNEPSKSLRYFRCSNVHGTHFSFRIPGMFTKRSFAYSLFIAYRCFCPHMILMRMCNMHNDVSEVRAIMQCFEISLLIFFCSSLSISRAICLTYLRIPKYLRNAV